MTPKTCIFRGFGAVVNHHSVAASLHLNFRKFSDRMEPRPHAVLNEVCPGHLLINSGSVAGREGPGVVNPESRDPCDSLNTSDENVLN